MRLIDADATFELLRNLGSRDYRRDKGTIMDAMKMISHSEYTPTVDAVPVVHGEWGQPNRFKDGVGLWRCDQCGEASIRRFRYCPECGSKMDKLKEVE